VHHTEVGFEQAYYINLQVLGQKITLTYNLNIYAKLPKYIEVNEAFITRNIPEIGCVSTYL
jgi:hypothetical protein